MLQKHLQLNPVLNGLKRGCHSNHKMIPTIKQVAPCVRARGLGSVGIVSTGFLRFVSTLTRVEVA